MPSRNCNRAVALILAAVLVLPVAVTAGERGTGVRARRAAAAPPQAPGPFTRIWAWLAVQWAKDGILIDPDGNRLLDDAPLAGISSSGVTPTTDGTVAETPR